jgi:hypothetical protein
MAKEIGEKADARAQAARRAATADGKTWASLSTAERRIYKQRAGGTGQAPGASPSREDETTAVRKEARRAAEAAGQTWGNLTREQRQKYVREARQKEKKGA